MLEELKMKFFNNDGSAMIIILTMLGMIVFFPLFFKFLGFSKETKKDIVIAITLLPIFIILMFLKF